MQPKRGERANHHSFFPGNSFLVRASVLGTVLVGGEGHNHNKFFPSLTSYPINRSLYRTLNSTCRFLQTVVSNLMTLSAIVPLKKINITYNQPSLDWHFHNMTVAVTVTPSKNLSFNNDSQACCCNFSEFICVRECIN